MFIQKDVNYMLNSTYKQRRIFSGNGNKDEHILLSGVNNGGKVLATSHRHGADCRQEVQRKAIYNIRTDLE